MTIQPLWLKRAKKCSISSPNAWSVDHGNEAREKISKRKRIRSYNNSNTIRDEKMKEEDRRRCWCALNVIAEIIWSFGVCACICVLGRCVPKIHISKSIYLIQNHRKTRTRAKCQTGKVIILRYGSEFLMKNPPKSETFSINPSKWCCTINCLRAAVLVNGYKICIMKLYAHQFAGNGCSSTVESVPPSFSAAVIVMIVVVVVVLFGILLLLWLLFLFYYCKYELRLSYLTHMNTRIYFCDYLHAYNL